jgi:precorrin-6B C5,15-methyltransferase / cobalt-precorrin-6B C5,C15-methyltransferase
MTAHRLPVEKCSSPPPWLSIVGVGADGESGLGEPARRAIAQAEVVIGSARQLGLVAALIGGERVTWPVPFAQGIALVLERRGRSTCVLASGDPFHYGVGATLAPHLAAGDFVCHPAPSSLSLAAARLAWPLQSTEVVSLHGRELHDVLRHLAPGRRLLVLSWNRETPAALARLLTDRGYGSSRLVVLEALGGPEERTRETRASDPALDDVLDLNIVGLELVASPSAFALPLRAGLPDSAFESDGQLTKRDVRAVTLSALAPRAGERLWDVGSGSGSIAIEWMLAHPACQAIAIERDAERCARIGRNASALGVSRLTRVHAEAPDALRGLPAPDAVFIGGGASEAVLELCRQALPSGGRLVVNAVALETQARLLEAYQRHGGELVRVAIEAAAPLGAVTALRPALAVLQWRLVRP